jgi:hypothetical protein
MNSILTELLPRRVRLWLYVLTFLASAGVAAYVASQGDWLAFAGSLLATLVSLLAAGNISPPPEDHEAKIQALVDQTYRDVAEQPPALPGDFDPYLGVTTARDRYDDGSIL